MQNTELVTKIYLIVTEEYFGGDFKMFKDQKDALLHIESLDKDAMMVPLDIKTNDAVITFSELYYGGYEKGHICTFESMEKANEFTNKKGEEEQLQFEIYRIRIE